MELSERFIKELEKRPDIEFKRIGRFDPLYGAVCEIKASFLPEGWNGVIELWTDSEGLHYRKKGVEI